MRIDIQYTRFESPKKVIHVGNKLKRYSSKKSPQKMVKFPLKNVIIN